MLRPIRRPGFAFRLKYLHSSDVHLRNLWRLFFLHPQAPNAPAQNPHRPTAPGACWLFSFPRPAHRAKSSRTTCAATFAPAPAELARAPGSPRPGRAAPQSVIEFERSEFSSEGSVQLVKGKG